MDKFFAIMWFCFILMWEIHYMYYVTTYMEDSCGCRLSLQGMYLHFFSVRLRLDSYGSLGENLADVWVQIGVLFLKLSLRSCEVGGIILFLNQILRNA